MVPLGQKKKVQLIQGAAGRGFMPFVRQTLLCAADSSLRKRHLVFRITADNVRNTPFTAPRDVFFREANSWDDLTKSAQSNLEDPGKGIDWGNQNWFDKGWRLWIAEKEDQLVSLGWWRSAQQSQDFFCPLPEDAEVLWHSTVLPEFQGQGLQVSLRLSLMRERVATGVTEFYTNCRDYNTPSRKNIERMGFRLIGYATDSKWTGRRNWHSLAAEDRT
jgi:RimJ/RimL family protein N-acetyltransferase